MVGNPVVRVTLGAAADGAVADLALVPGVTGVSEDGDGRFRIEHAPEADPREAIFRLAVMRGWVLLELAQEKATLEDVFVRITTHDAAAADVVAQEV
jgi:hypothetical protein